VPNSTALSSPIHDGQVDRNPGRVEKRKEAVAGQELAQRVQIAQGLGRGVHAAACKRLFETRVEQALAQQRVQARTDPHHDPRPNPLQPTHRGQQEQHDQRQHQQGRQARAGDRPVIDLQHVERGNQHQQVDEKTEEGNGKKAAFARGKSILQLGPGVGWHGSFPEVRLGSNLEKSKGHRRADAWNIFSWTPLGCPHNRIYRAVSASTCGS
jgi:hypothetical protein